MPLTRDPDRQSTLRAFRQGAEATDEAPAEAAMNETVRVHQHVVRVRDLMRFLVEAHYVLEMLGLPRTEKNLKTITLELVRRFHGVCPECVQADGGPLPQAAAV